MTKETGFDKIAILRNEWAAASNAQTDQTKLFQLAELFISEMDVVLILAGGHPEPPPPRVHP